MNNTMEIKRQKFRVSHAHKKQKIIINEYTIKSKVEKLNDVIILSDVFLSDLSVLDEDGSILPIMNTTDIKRLIVQQIKKISNDKQHTDAKQKLEELNSKVDARELHVIWIKLPKNKSLTKNEIRTFRLKYSPHQKDISDSILKITIKQQSHPMYYTLLTPNEFTFNRIKYNIIKNGEIESNYTQPKHVEKFTTSDSQVFRIPSKIEKNFDISYSFKPTSESTKPLKIGLYTLGVLSATMLVLKIITLLEYVENFAILDKQIEIGLFVIGGSILLPQLTNNYSIRARYTWKFLMPIVLGILILI